MIKKNLKRCKYTTVKRERIKVRENLFIDGCFKEYHIKKLYMLIYFSIMSSEIIEYYFIKEIKNGQYTFH